jgi:amidophosphoribosyltransferase
VLVDRPEVNDKVTRVAGPFVVEATIAPAQTVELDASARVEEEPDVQSLDAALGDADVANGGIAIAHNGNLTNAHALRKRLVRNGSIFDSTSDTECIVHLVATSPAGPIVERLIDALKQVEGAYALIVMTPEGMIACRDPLGIRPLVMGKLNDSIIFASETVALDVVGAEFVRSVEPGELVIVQGSEMRSIRPFGPVAPRPCIFEWVYFSRPDSIVDDHSVYSVRKAIGAQLAIEAPVEADLVVPVPDSGVPAAIGYAQESGIPFELGIIRSHYVGRTFIQPTQLIRDFNVRVKLNLIGESVKGKRVVVVDDSIVRGTTSQKIVRMLREAGALEVHLRISSPPMTGPCHYGIDTPDEDTLIAARHDVARIRSFLSVDSLAYLSVQELREAVGTDQGFCDACFTGDYPTRLTDMGERAPGCNPVKLKKPAKVA